jgi:acyl-coenzyme A thioesterase PaaI-like protein
MDSATAIALRELRGEGASLHASVEMNAGFLADAYPGDQILVSGRVSSLEEAVAFGEADVRRQPDGELLATARITFGIQAP